MMKLYFLVLLCLLAACSSQKTETPNASEVEKKMERWYHAGLQEVYTNNSRSQLFLDSMSAVSAHVDSDYKAMELILSANNTSQKSIDIEVFEKLTRAELLLQNSKRKDLKIRVYNGIALFYKVTGDFANAMRYMLQALKLADDTKDSDKIAHTQTNLGALYLEKGDMVSAKKHLDMGLDLLRNDKKQSLYLVASHLMANYWGMSGNLEKAMALDEEGIALSTQIESNILKAPFVDNKATCFFYSNQIDSAKAYYLKCIELDRLTENQRQESDSYANLANVAQVQNKGAEAIAYLDSSLVLAQKTNYKRGYLKAYEIEIDIHKREKDYKNLAEAQVKYLDTYKALMNEKKENSLAQYKIIYETEKKEKKLLQSKINIGLKEKQIQSKNSLLQMLGIITLALVGLGFLIYRQLKMRNRQQRQEFELKSAIKEIETQNSLQNQRLHISRDLHDNIGAQLTFIISSVENLNYAFPDENPKVSAQLDKINDFAKNTIVELRDTIWAMNSKHISSEDLKARIYNFLEKAQGVKDEIKFSFTISKNLSDYDFSALQGVNVYRVLQEAVNNAIKYAEAKDIAVYMDTLENVIQITIEDNGVGFLKETVSLGNGLINMEKRMEEIGGRFELKSTINSGTILVLTCPKTKENA